MPHVNANQITFPDNFLPKFFLPPRLPSPASGSAKYLARITFHVEICELKLIHISVRSLGQHLLLEIKDKDS